MYYITGENHSHAQLGLPDNGFTIKGLVVCYVVWLGYIKGMVLRTFAGIVSLVPCCGHRSITVTPHRNKTTYHSYVLCIYVRIL